MLACLPQHKEQLGLRTGGNAESAEPRVAANPVIVAKYRHFQNPSYPMLAAEEHEAFIQRATNRHRDVGAQAQTRARGRAEEIAIDLKIAGADRDRCRQSPTRKRRKTKFKEII